MDLYSARSLALSLMEEHGILSKWNFDYDRSKRRFGLCDHTHKVISLSYHLVALNNEQKVRDIILHEIAHAVVGPGKAHGAEWRKVAANIGCSAERCYTREDTKVPARTYVGRCPNGHVSIKRFRRRKLICKRCMSRIVWSINRE